MLPEKGGTSFFTFKDGKMKEAKTEGLTRYQKIQKGLEEPQGSEKGWLNLEKRTSFNMMDEEKRREICRKGAEAVNKLHGKKKTAREALENILTLKITDEILDGAEVPPDIAARMKRDNPDATLYDLIQIVAVGRAVGGNVKAMEYVRDTHGDKPVDKVDITADVTTEADRALMRQVAERLDGAEVVRVVSEIPQDDEKNPP